MLVKGVVAHYGLFKGLKPGMRENMDQVNENLQKITQAVDTLAREHISLAGDAAEEKKKQWSEVEQALQITGKALNEIKNLYSLDHDETDMVQKLITAKEAELENLRIQAAKDSAGHDSGEKTTAEKTTGEKPVKSKPADSSKPAAANKKP